MDEKFFAYCLKEGIFDSDLLVSSPLDPRTCSYEMLVREGYVGQERLAIAAGAFYDCLVVDLSRLTPELEAIRYGSVSVCRRLCFVPFAVDPLVGVIVALADYTRVTEITSYLKDMNVEHVKFYIAPYASLMQMIERIYGSEGAVSPSISDKSRRMALRTQCIDFEPKMEDKEKRIDLLERDVKAGRSSMNTLEERVHRLESQLACQDELIHEMASLLCAHGMMDSERLKRWDPDQ